MIQNIKMGLKERREDLEYRGELKVKAIFTKLRKGAKNLVFIVELSQTSITCKTNILNNGIKQKLLVIKTVEFSCFHL